MIIGNVSVIHRKIMMYKWDQCLKCHTFKKKGVGGGTPSQRLNRLVRPMKITFIETHNTYHKITVKIQKWHIFWIEGRKGVVGRQ